MQPSHQDVDTTKVTELMEKGVYFHHARMWYHDLYHRPLAERSFFILISAFAALTIFFSLLVYVSMQPLSRTIPYTIYTDDIGSTIPKIMPLKQSRTEVLSLSLARYLVSDYVKMREAYQYDVTKLEWQFNRVREVSDYGEFRRYRAQVSSENPASPLSQYGRDAMRDVNIYSESFNLEGEQKTATVYFVTQVKRGQQVQQNNWLANITFRMPEYVVDSETNDVVFWNQIEKEYQLTEQIDFKVLSYEVQEITQQ